MVSRRAQAYWRMHPPSSPYTMPRGVVIASRDTTASDSPGQSTASMNTPSSRYTTPRGVVIARRDTTASDSPGHPTISPRRRATTSGIMNSAPHRRDSSPAPPDADVAAASPLPTSSASPFVVSSHMVRSPVSSLGEPSTSPVLLLAFSPPPRPAHPTPPFTRFSFFSHNYHCPSPAPVPAQDPAAAYQYPIESDSPFTDHYHPAFSPYPVVPHFPSGEMYPNHNNQNSNSNAFPRMHPMSGAPGTGQQGIFQPPVYSSHPVMPSPVDFPPSFVSYSHFVSPTSAESDTRFYIPDTLDTPLTPWTPSASSISPFPVDSARVAQQPEEKEYTGPLIVSSYPVRPVNQTVPAPQAPFVGAFSAGVDSANTQFAMDNHHNNNFRGTAFNNNNINQGFASQQQQALAGQHPIMRPNQGFPFQQQQPMAGQVSMLHSSTSSSRVVSRHGPNQSISVPGNTPAPRVFGRYAPNDNIPPHYPDNPAFRAPDHHGPTQSISSGNAPFSSHVMGNQAPNQNIPSANLTSRVMHHQGPNQNVPFSGNTPSHHMGHHGPIPSISIGNTSSRVIPHHGPNQSISYSGNPSAPVVSHGPTGNNAAFRNISLRIDTSQGQKYNNIPHQVNAAPRAAGNQVPSENMLHPGNAISTLVAPHIPNNNTPSYQGGATPRVSAIQGTNNTSSSLANVTPRPSTLAPNQLVPYEGAETPRAPGSHASTPLAAISITHSVTLEVPFDNQARYHPVPTAAVLKISNIPYNLTTAEVLHFVGRHAQLLPAERGSSVHIIMERSTAKTMDCYVEFVTLADAQTALQWINRNVPVRSPRLGDRHVVVELSSQATLLANIFPRAKCVAWVGGRPEIQPNPDSFSSGFQGFVTTEEMFCMVHHAEAPKRAPFAEKCPQRTYEYMASMLDKFPWHATELYTIEHRNMFFDAVRRQLQTLADKIQGRRTIQLDGRLLSILLNAGLRCPAFNERQKFFLRAASGNVSGDIPQTVTCWPFDTLTLRVGSQEGSVAEYARVIRAGVLRRVPDLGELKNSWDAIQHGTSPYGPLMLEWQGESARQSLQAAVNAETRVMRALVSEGLAALNNAA
ncbi:hypothetical protein FQN57_000789 [Myotisia sp. PD_48]|nr:hypothetical protein FQN57_000789 [Myotisia sp. PD_48]